jgi:hypothetical protein
MKRLNVVVDDDADANAFCLQQFKKCKMYLQNNNEKSVTGVWI